MFKLVSILVLSYAVSATSVDGLRKQLPVSHISRTKRQLGLVTPVHVIVQQVQDYLPDGSYYFSYRTTNGISAEERGNVHMQGPGVSTKTVQGRYDYTSPEGVPVSVNYNADNNGYRPMTRLGHIGAGGASRPRINTQQK